MKQALSHVASCTSIRASTLAHNYTSTDQSDDILALFILLLIQMTNTMCIINAELIHRIHFAIFSPVSNMPLM